jgi:hypothetical protein
MATAEHWRTSQPELHLFARKIDDLFSNGLRREWLASQLQEYKTAEEQFKESHRQWKEERKAYFETHLLKLKATFRDETSVGHADLVWDGYERLLKSQVAIDGVGTKLRYSKCVRLWPNPDGQLVPTRMGCFTDNGDGTGRVNVVGWIPRHLFVFDDAHEPSSPLPPQELKGGRGYTVPEICYGLAVIHDADGSFSPFAAEGSAIGDLFGVEFWWVKARVKGTEIAMWRAAEDDWLISLEPLLAKASAAIEAQCPSGAPSPHAHQAHDEKLFPRGPLDDGELMGAIAAVHDGRGIGKYDIEILRIYTGESTEKCPRAIGLQSRIRRARQDGRTTLAPAKRSARCAR